jgi:hypothetical protein
VIVVSSFNFGAVKSEAAAATKQVQYTVTGDSIQLTKQFDLPSDFGTVTDVKTNTGQVSNYSVDTNTKKLNVTVNNGSRYTVNPDPNSRKETWSNNFYCNADSCSGRLEVSPRIDYVLDYVYFESRSGFKRSNDTDITWGAWSQTNYINEVGYATFDVAGIYNSRGTTTYAEVRGYTKDIKTYSYTVTLEYTSNSSPVVNITTTGDKTLYNDGGTFTISGTVQDPDNDTVTVSSTIGGVTKKIDVTGTSAAKSWTLTWGGAEVPVGVYTNPQVTITDGKATVTANYPGKLTILAQVYYYWSKFSVSTQFELGPWSTPVSGTTVPGGINGYSSYSLNPTTGVLTLSGVASNLEVVGNIYIQPSPGNLNKYTFAGSESRDVYYKYSWANVVSSTVRGSLIQSNIRAVQGAYPDDGIHSDGYWYVKSGTVPNNMPTISVTSSGDKSINLKSGSDTFTITGTVSDADNDALSVSATIGGVTKQVGVSNTSIAKSFTLTWRTVEFTSSGSYSNPVMTVDDGRGGTITKAYSGKLTVDKTPLFYWDKYNAERKWVAVDSLVSSTTDTKALKAYPSYLIDQSRPYPGSGYIGVSGSVITLSNVGSVGYLSFGSGSGVGETQYGVKRYELLSYSDKIYTYKTTEIYAYYNWVKLNLLQSNIQDLEGTYPDNGVHTDGYWYTKKATTNMAPVLTVVNSDIQVNKAKPALTLTGTVGDTDGDTVTVSATINGVTKTVQVTSPTVSKPWSLTWSESDLPEGAYTGFVITANDGKDGVDAIVYTGTIVIDRTAPVITISPDDQSWTNEPIDIDVHFEDTLSGINPNERKYKITTTPDVPISWDTADSDQISLILEDEGQWYVHTKGQDLAGNESYLVSGPYQLQHDPKIPELRIITVGTEWAEIGWNLPANTYTDGYKYTVENITTNQRWTLEQLEDKIKDTSLEEGITYQYRIKAANHVGETDWSEPLEVLTLPGKVGNVKVGFLPNQSSTVTVTFDKVRSATSYHLVIKDALGGFVYDEELSQAGEYKIDSLQPGKQYSVSVTAKNMSGAGESSTISFLSLPAAPGEFQSAQIREHEVELTWNPSETANLYELLRGLDTELYKGPELTYTDTGLESGTEYDYQLAAKNNSGFGDIAYLNSILTLPAKTELKVERIRANEVELSWETIQGAEKYILVVNGKQAEELPAAADYFKVKSLSPGTNYTFELYAVNRSGSGIADQVSIRTVPDQPAGLTVTEIGESKAKLSWDSVYGADKYRIAVGDSEFETSGAEYDLTGLSGGTEYSVKVSAGNESGYGETALESILTLPYAPDNLQVVKVLSDAFTLSWDAVKSADRYLVYSKDGKAIGESAQNQFTVTNLSPGETYTVYVAAENASGESKQVAYTQRTLPGSWVDPSDPNGSGKDPVNVGDRTESTVVIEVLPVPGADEYKVVDGEGNILGIIKSPELAKEIGGLESAKEYEDWMVIPVNDAGEGKGTPVPPFVTLPSTNYQVKVTADRQKELTIHIETQLKNEIFVITQAGKELYRGKEKEFTVKNLADGQSYTFEVWTENSIKEKTKPVTVTEKTLEAPVSPGSGSSGQGQDGKEQPGSDKEQPVEGNGGNTTENGQGGSSGVGFQDINNSYAKNEILALYDKGIVKGVSDTRYEPNRKVTRVEFASMLVRALELQEASNAPLTFEDIQRTAWYVPELGAAVLNGVAKGFSDKQFRPQDPINREQAAKMIANAIYSGSLPTGDIHFKDAREIATWAHPEVVSLTEVKVIAGYPDNTFKPKRDLTRAECAVLIYRAIELIN